jgi:hypothetical protein
MPCLQTSPSSNTQHFALKMSATLAKQFEDYALRCLELARSAKTAGRAHFMQTAREYQSAAALIRERTDLSAGYHNWHPLQPPYDFDGWPQNVPSVREARNDQSIAR